MYELGLNDWESVMYLCVFDMHNIVILVIFVTWAKYIWLYMYVCIYVCVYVRTL